MPIFTTLQNNNIYHYYFGSCNTYVTLIDKNIIKQNRMLDNEQTKTDSLYRSFPFFFSPIKAYSVVDFEKLRSNPRQRRIGNTSLYLLSYQKTSQGQADFSTTEKINGKWETVYYKYDFKIKDGDCLKKGLKTPTTTL